jgi:hypothetical protein
MTDAPPGLGGPNAKSNGDRASEKDCPPDPSRLLGKLGQRKEGHEGKNPGCIDHGSGGIRSVSMLSERCFAGIIQSGLNRPVHEGIVGTPARLHNGGHDGGAEDDGKKPRGEGPAVMKEDADQDRQTGDSQPDDRDMVDGQMEVGRGEELIHKSKGGLGP